MCRVLVVSLLLACGCNQLLGLDETISADAGQLAPDRDGDGTGDDLDNCADLANPDQRDADADGRGDACDGCTGCSACATGPDHDEDGDQLPDGCDNCPTMASADVTNSDGDDLGDVCDASPGMQRRVFFDGFGDQAAYWAVVGTWEVSGDDAAAIEGPHPFNYRLTHLGTLIDGATPWTVEIAFDVPVSAVELDSIGVNMLDDQGTPKWGCTVSWQDSTWNLTNGIPQPIELGAGRTTMTLGSQRAMSPDRLCRVAANPERSSLSFNDPYPQSFELFASRTTRFAYVEVIE